MEDMEDKEEQNPLYLRAMQLYNRREYEMAAKEFREALKRDPEHLPSHQFLAMTLSLSKKHAEAQREIAWVLEREPNDVGAIYIAALVKYNQGRYDEASRLNKQVLSLEPDYAESHLLEGRLSFHKKNWKSAKEHCLRAVECDPELTEAYVILAKTLHHMKESKQAIETLRSVLTLTPNDSDSHALLGLLLLDQGDRKGAQEHLREALRLNPNSEAAIEGFIECLRNRNILYFWFMSFVFVITAGPLRFLLWLRILYPPLIGLYLFFFIFVWMVKQFVNLSLQLDPEVRKYLPPEFKKRNRRFVSMILISMAVLSCAGYFSAEQQKREDKEVATIVGGVHNKAGDAKMDKVYEEMMSSFLDDKYFSPDEERLNQLKKYEMDKPFPSKERLAYLAIWTGIELRGSLKDKGECQYFEEAMKLAKDMLGQKTNEPADKNTDKLADKNTNKPADKNTDKPADKNTDESADDNRPGAQQIYDYAFDQLAYSVYPSLPAPGRPQWKNSSGAWIKNPQRSFGWLETSTIFTFIAEANPSEALDRYVTPLYKTALEDFFTKNSFMYQDYQLNNLLTYEKRRKPVNSLHIALVDLLIVRTDISSRERQKEVCLALINDARTRATQLGLKSLEKYCDDYADFINKKRKERPSPQELAQELKSI